MNNQPPRAELPPLPISDSEWQEIAEEIGLSPRLSQIVELILRNQSDKQIAAELNLAFPTVRTYLKRIFDLLGVDDRTGIVLHIFAFAIDRAECDCRQSC